MRETLEKAVKECASKVVNAKNCADAMQYAQAALNAAHALQVLKQVEITR